MYLVRLFSWIEDFLSVIIEQSVCSLILQSFDGFLVSMFSGLLLLSDASEITLLILAVLLLVFESNFFCSFLHCLELVFQLFCHLLCLDHFFKSILRYTGHLYLHF